MTCVGVEWGEWGEPEQAARHLCADHHHPPSHAILYVLWQSYANTRTGERPIHAAGSLACTHVRAHPSLRPPHAPPTCTMQMPLSAHSTSLGLNASKGLGAVGGN